MAALVTLEAAKGHLRVTDAASDDDLQRKIDAASGIIIDYLKSRANIVATIVSSSVASPTLITTEDAHGMSNGDTVTIADHEDSTPDLNGSYVLTYVSSATFTIPVAVTVAGTGGTATVAWTESTVPAHVQMAVLLMLTHLHENRGDDMKSDEALWAAIRRLLERNRDPAYA